MRSETTQFIVGLLACAGHPDQGFIRSNREAE